MSHKRRETHPAGPSRFASPGPQVRQEWGRRSTQILSKGSALPAPGRHPKQHTGESRLSFISTLFPSSPLLSMGVQEEFLFPAREWETLMNENSGTCGSVGESFPPAPHRQKSVQPGDLPQPLVRVNWTRVDPGLCPGQLPTPYLGMVG